MPSVQMLSAISPGASSGTPMAAAMTASSLDVDQRDLTVVADRRARGRRPRSGGCWRTSSRRGAGRRPGRPSRGSSSSTGRGVAASSGQTCSARTRAVMRACRATVCGADPAGGHGLGVEAAGAVAGAHEGPAHDAGEADGRGDLGEVDELLGADPALHRMVPRAGAQVLGDGDEVAAGRVRGRASAWWTSSISSPMPRMRLLLVTRPAARAWVMTSRLRSYVNAGRMRLNRRGTVSTLWASTSGAAANTSPSRAGLPEKSGMRTSTPVPGLSAWICADGLGVQPGALVGQVVAGDAGDGGVPQPHRAHRLGDAARLVAVEGRGLAGVDLAEVAAAGALLAADEERGLAVLPALVDVGAAGLLAHRVQALGLAPARGSR